MLARHRLDVAARVVAAGGVIAYPTEAVFGLGCLPLDLDAVGRIIDIKGRSAAKGLILIADTAERLAPFVALPAGDLGRRVVASWPGPVTWVLPARDDVPDLLTGGRGTLAVRVTAHPAASRLCRRVGSPLVSTSANRSGRRPARSALEVRCRLGAAIDHVHAGPLGVSAKPTEIRSGLDGRVLRAG